MRQEFYNRRFLQAEARRNNFPCGFSKPLCDVLSLQQSLPNATSFASTRLSQRPVLAAMLGICCSLRAPRSGLQRRTSRRADGRLRRLAAPYPGQIS